VAGERLEFGLRGDVLVQWISVAHLSADDPVADRKQRWNAGADILAGVGFRVAEGSAIVVNSGIELLLGETQLHTHGRRVATLAAQRWLGSVGFRVDY
jgi:hypothetical protein